LLPRPILTQSQVKGVPVLFIPGNAGSYKQMRPLASDAAHWFAEHVQQDSDAINAGIRGLDFFTADFNEEFTAFHGQTLLDQAEYLNDAIGYILSLYHDPKRSRRDPGLPDPTSVIVVGHSMGGIVARTMLVMPNYQSNSINTIITMSTPHARAPVSFDAGIVSTYAKINDYWRQAYSQKWANDNPLWHVTLISIAGGGLDTIVPSDYASLSSLVPDTHGFTVFTSGVPNVWTGTDHLSIIWCDQLSHVIPRALIEAVDVTRPGQTKPRAQRMRIFKKWFLTGMERVGEKTLPLKEPTTLLTLEDNSNSVLNVGEKLTIRQLGQSGKTKAYLLPVPPQSLLGATKFTLLSDQILDEAGASGSLEVLFCSVYPLHPGQSAQLFSMNMDLSGSTSGSTRLACKNAASDVIKLPASNSASRWSWDEGKPFSYLEYSVEQLNEHQFVAIVDKSKAPTPGWVVAEFSDTSRSVINSGVGLRKLLTSGLHLTLPAGRPLVTDVKIPAVHSSLLAYKLKVGSSSCGDSTPLFMPLLRQYLSEPFESKFFVNVKETDINIHGIAPFMPPALRAHAMTDGISLQMWSDPTCNSSIDLDLRVDFLGSLGKLVMRYRTVFPAFPLVIIALVLRKQFMIHDRTGIFMTFTEALDLCLRSSLPILLLAMMFCSMSLASSSSHPSGSTSASFLHWSRNSTESAIDYTKNDLLLGSQDPFFWFLIPLFGLVSAGVCVLLNYAALLLIHLCTILFKAIIASPSWFRGDDRRRTLGPAFTPTTPRRRLIITSALLFMVSTIIPYQFAYMVACIAQIATCTRALRVALDTVSVLLLPPRRFAY
jgi:glycosylphosphatidylinositol deacylase